MSAGLEGLVAALREHPTLGSCLVHAAFQSSQEARFAEPRPPVPAPLGRGLASLGVERLWSHQAEGLEASRGGQHVLVTTPTASGKSLIFHLPVLEEAIAGGSGRALFLYPLKALGQDQRVKFEALVEAAGLVGGEATCEIYDGDTPRSLRARIRRHPPRVLISNPDMLHLGILGYWHGWAAFLRDLKWVVLDELHTYRGIFGSHFHHVLQRLLRLCRHQGAEPLLIASSATAANAGEFAQLLTGEAFHWIREAGSPRQARHLLFFQPAGSAYSTALDLFVFLLRQGLKTIAFTKARRITELLYSWLGKREPGLAERVSAYRAGFLPEERRRIERQLFEGTLDGVISTSALEMGIDVGGLDACILVGYPGSIMATWQRAGRTGRGGRESLTALVALPDALDQYLLQHPEALLDRPCEELVLDPANEPVSRSHLLCAAAELPLSSAGDRPYLERHAVLVGELLRDNELRQSVEGGEIFPARRRPHRGVALRGGGARFSIVRAESGSVIGTVDGVRVMRECHPGAIYLHAGRQYHVTELDRADGRVVAEPVSVDYFTAPLTEKETEILEVLEERREGALQAWLGRLEVTERVVGYERRRISGQGSMDQRSLDLPPMRFETVGLWWAAPPPIRTILTQRGEHFLGSLHATEHAAISLFPLLALCDRGDIGGISLPLHPQVGCGAVFIYDGHPGGVGLAVRGFRDLTLLLRRVLELLEACECEDGCPSCIQSPRCGNGNRPLDKHGAARILRLLLGDEELLAEAAAQGVEVCLRPMETREDPAGTPPAPPAEVPGGATAPRPERSEVPSIAADGRAAGTPHGATPRRAVPQGSTGPRPDGGGPIEVALGSRGRPRRTRRTKTSPRPGTTVLFDVETRRSAEDVGGWSKIHRMGLAVAVVCFLEEDRFQTFFESDVEDLVSALRAADLVVGFNIRRFDYLVLSGYTGADYGRVLPTLDLLEEIHRSLGFRLSLNHLVQETLGAEKTADGLQSIEWVRQGRLDLVESYCQRDVELLRDLYLFGRREGYLCYRDRQERRVRLPVDW